MIVYPTRKCLFKSTFFTVKLHLFVVSLFVCFFESCCRASTCVSASLKQLRTSPVFETFLVTQYNLCSQAIDWLTTSFAATVFKSAIVKETFPEGSVSTSRTFSVFHWGKNNEPKQQVLSVVFTKHEHSRTWKLGLLFRFHLTKQ